MTSVSDGETLVDHPEDEERVPGAGPSRAQANDEERVAQFKNFVEAQLKIMELKKEALITLALTRKAYREEIESHTDLSDEEKGQLCRDLDRVSMDLQQWVLRK